jgi:hypothetical protein
MRRVMLLLGVCLFCSPVEARDPDKSKPADLSPSARTLLHSRMQRHAEDMATIHTNVLHLRYDATAEAAMRIAVEPRLARPSRDPTLLNANIPDEFYAEQDSLMAAARDLANAARKHADLDMAKAYGRLAETCVSCHARFLER